MAVKNPYGIITTARSPSIFIPKSMFCHHTRYVLFHYELLTVPVAIHPALEHMHTVYLYSQRKKVTQPDYSKYDSRAATVSIVLQLSVSLFCFGLKFATLKSDWNICVNICYLYFPFCYIFSRHFIFSFRSCWKSQQSSDFIQLCFYLIFNSKIMALIWKNMLTCSWIAVLQSEPLSIS